MVRASSCSFRQRGFVVPRMGRLRGLRKVVVLGALLLTILAIAALVTDLAVGHPTRPADGLVQGKILWYWCEPACSAPIPFPASAIRFRAADGRTWTAVAKPDGSYAITLPAGKYSVSLPGTGEVTSGPSIVQVVSGETLGADYLLRHVSG
jgi:hypothetical protein